MDVPSLPDISTFAAPLYVAIIIAEIIAVGRRRVRGDYETKDALTSLFMGTGSVISDLLAGGFVALTIGAIYAWVYSFRLMTVPFNGWTIALCFVLYDHVYYWSHRFQHTIRWGWASHVIHHSSQHFNFSTALRQPWFSFITGSFVLSVPLVLLGFHPAMIAFSASLNLFYQFFVHTEAVGRLPRWIEAVFNTPSHHRVHHGKNPKYLDANYAGALIIWDRLYGTFVPEEDAEPVRYGLVTDLGTYNPFRVASHEYVAIFRDLFRPGLTLKQRLGYLFAPPGWSHDGSRLTSKDIKAREQRVRQAIDPPARQFHPAE